MEQGKPVTRIEALEIAATQLRNSYYRENLQEGLVYNLLDFDLESEDVIYHGKKAYHIYVNGGTFCFEPTEEYRKKRRPGSIFSKLNHCFGEFEEGVNHHIECLIIKDTGEYIYLKRKQ